MSDTENKPPLSRLLVTIIEVAILIAVIVAVVLVLRAPVQPRERLELATGYGLLIFLFSLGVIFLVEVLAGRIEMQGLLEEMDGGASTSRLQLMMFSFVFAFSFFFLVALSGKFPEIPANVLILLGISASTYGVSKGLQVASGETGGDDSGNPGNTPGQGK